MSSSEPNWTRQFSNESVCNYFYYLSVAILILGVIGTLYSSYLISVAPKGLGSILVVGLIGQLAGLTISYFIYLFAYLTCSRSLLK